ncbi:hypothetical protein HK105_208997 [Polyrhizophydium stewartii]|uniref:Polyketide cyclase/dehydrase n=1 Tax=Polyrhizophydium stewartii TaxID=2732419 RepID=A0ABR4MWC5_9FUNG|nr:hypothetical protein HK105_006122 [Polyrhizophydium stewartii]
MPPYCTVQSSWVAQESIDIAGNPERLWDILCDVPNWPVWDDGLEGAALDDPARGAVTGATGFLQMKERGEFNFVLADLAKNEYFAYDVNLSGALSHWFWDFGRPAADGKGFVLTMGVVVSGFLAPLYKWWIEKECREAFQRAVAALKKLVEDNKPSIRAMLRVKAPAGDPPIGAAKPKPTVGMIRPITIAPPMSQIKR